MGGYGWGEVNKQDLIDAVRAALDAGVTMFDTADTYGLGQSEETLAAALGHQRENVTIATKFGVRVENGKTFYDNSPQWIRKAVEGSLRRLKTEYIDLYQIHYRDVVTPIGAVIETLNELKQEGKIRYYGLSNIHKKDIAELKMYAGAFVSFQDEYSLACRKNEQDILHLSQEMEMTPLTWGSLGQGILTGKYDKNSTFEANDRRSRDIYVNFHGEKLLKNLEIVKELKEIAAQINTSVSSVAIRFILDYIPQSVVLAGIKSPEQLKGNCDAFGWVLTEEQLLNLKRVSDD